MPSSAPRSGLLGAERGKPSLGWMVGWAEKGEARAVFALNMDCKEPRHIADRMNADAGLPQGYRRDLRIFATAGAGSVMRLASSGTNKKRREDICRDAFRNSRMDQLNEQQKPLGEQIMKVSSVGIGGPYNPLMRSPVLGQRLFDLFYYLRWETSVPTQAQRVRDPDHRPAVALAGGMVRACADRGQGRVCRPRSSPS